MKIDIKQGQLWQFKMSGACILITHVGDTHAVLTWYTKDRMIIDEYELDRLFYLLRSSDHYELLEDP